MDEEAKKRILKASFCIFGLIGAFMLGALCSLRYTHFVATNEWDYLSNFTDHPVTDQFNCTSLFLVDSVQTSVCTWQHEKYLKTCQGEPYFSSCILLDASDISIIHHRGLPALAPVAN